MSVGDKARWADSLTSDGLCDAFRGELAPTRGAPVDFAFHAQSGEFGQFRGITARPRSGYIYTRLNPGPSTACSLFPASPCGDIPIDRARRSRMLAIRSAISPPVRHPAIVLPARLPLPSARAQRSAADQSPFPPRSARLPWSKNSRLSDRLVSRPGPPSRGCPRADLEPAHERTLHRLARFMWLLIISPRALTHYQHASVLPCSCSKQCPPRCWHNAHPRLIAAIASPPCSFPRTTLPARPPRASRATRPPARQQSQPGESAKPYSSSASLSPLR